VLSGASFAQMKSAGSVIIGCIACFSGVSEQVGKLKPSKMAWKRRRLFRRFKKLDK